MRRRDIFLLLCFFFGLLHGLGFASALSGIGLPRNDILGALLAFNVGIEFGQILFIVSAFFVFKTFLSSFSNV